MDSESQYREQIVEYRFLSDLIQFLASTGRKLEILRGDADSYGYDLILRVDDVTRFVQLKSVKRGGKTARWDIHRPLIQNDDGAFILVLIDYDGKDISLSYRIHDDDQKSAILEREPRRKQDSDKYCNITRGFLKDEVSVEGVASDLFGVEEVGPIAANSRKGNL